MNDNESQRKVSHISVMQLSPRVSAVLCNEGGNRIYTTPEGEVTVNSMRILGRVSPNVADVISEALTMRSVLGDNSKLEPRLRRVLEDWYAFVALSKGRKDPVWTPERLSPYFVN